LEYDAREVEWLELVIAGTCDGNVDWRIFRGCAGNLRKPREIKGAVLSAKWKGVSGGRTVERTEIRREQSCSVMVEGGLGPDMFMARLHFPAFEEAGVRSTCVVFFFGDEGKSDGRISIQPRLLQRRVDLSRQSLREQARKGSFIGAAAS
jgi:hypothetical protein